MDDNTPTPDVEKPAEKPAAQLKPRPAPLPAKINQWERFIKQERTLNDMVEEIHRLLVDESEDYRNYLEAVYDEDAVEGSLAADNTMAAMMIREKAQTQGSEVAHKKLATISKALNIVMRRYHADRKRRRNTVGGEFVPPDSQNTPDNGS
jgi:hypothetical protein